MDVRDFNDGFTLGLREMTFDSFTMEISTFTNNAAHCLRGFGPDTVITLKKTNLEPGVYDR